MSGETHSVRKAIIMAAASIRLEEQDKKEPEALENA